MRFTPPLASAFFLAAPTIALPRAALAAKHHSEPTDRDLQDPGLVEVDFALGREGRPGRAFTFRSPGDGQRSPRSVAQLHGRPPARQR